MHTLNFWNGNKSAIRATYEPEIFTACLTITACKANSCSLDIDNTDRPAAIDESNIFINGADALVTVAGNPKFAKRDKIVIETVIDKGLLGFRGLIGTSDTINKLQACKSSQALQNFSIGIPDTWVDAELFRQNGFRVVEQGLLDDLFPRLTAGQFDFTSLGMNEIKAILTQFTSSTDEVFIVPEIMLFYSMPLVFYVHPEKPELARRLEAGLKRIEEDGQLDSIFEKHYGDILQSMDMNNRNVIRLNNPFLKGRLEQYQPTLI